MMRPHASHNPPAVTLPPVPFDMPPRRIRPTRAATVSLAVKRRPLLPEEHRLFQAMTRHMR